MKYLFIALFVLSACAKDSDTKHMWACTHDQGGDCDGYGKMTVSEADKYMEDHPHCHCEIIQ